MSFPDSTNPFFLCSQILITSVLIEIIDSKFLKIEIVSKINTENENKNAQRRETGGDERGEVVWCGVMWCGVEGCGMEWNGMEWIITQKLFEFLRG
jgi:hypothetical protein